MFADRFIASFDGMFSHALKVGIRWTANPLRVGERFREVRLGEAKEFGFVKIIIEFRSVFSLHRFALPASIPHSDRTTLYVARSEPLPGNGLNPARRLA